MQINTVFYSKKSMLCLSIHFAYESLKADWQMSRAVLLENLAKDYEECAELGKTLATLYSNAYNGRHNNYNLFKLDFSAANTRKQRNG